MWAHIYLLEGCLRFGRYFNFLEFHKILRTAYFVDNYSNTLQRGSISVVQRYRRDVVKSTGCVHVLSTAFYSNELNAIRFWNINNNSLYIAPENRITEFNLSMKNSLFNGLSRLNGIQSACSNCESIHSTTSTYLNHICGFCGLIFKNSTLFNRKVLGQPFNKRHCILDVIESAL